MNKTTKIIALILALLVLGYAAVWAYNDMNMTEEVSQDVIDNAPEGEMMDKNMMDDMDMDDSSVDPSSGTMLAGSDMPTVDENGNELIGGDAVAPTETPGEVSFTVLGGNFYYDMEEIRVKEGDTVTINFRSVDGFHDWVVDEFDAATEKVSTNGETSVTFVADTAGEYEYYCSVGSHRANGMVGTLIVE